MPQPILAALKSAQEPAPKRRNHRRAKPQLATRAELDKRTNAAKVFARLVTAIEQDLGGANHLSTIERELIEGFAGAALTTRGLNVKIALGEEISPTELSTCVSTLTRVAQRLGLQRRSKDVPSLSDLLQESPHDGEQGDSRP